MQKKIIVLAIAAAMTAPAIALADASVYGIVDMAAANVSGDGTKSDMNFLSGGLSTSRLGVNAAEDVGNGMKASVNLEVKLDTSQSAGLGTARQQMVGLSGNFGTVNAGYLQTTGYYWAAKFNPVEGSSVSPLNNVVKGGGFLISAASGYNRLSHAIGYNSPNFSGVTIGANYSAGVGDVTNIGHADNVATGLKTTAYMLSVNWEGGPAAAGFVYTKSTNDSTPIVPTASEYALGGSYDFGVAKAFATYQSNTPSGTANDTASKAYSVSATAPAGPGTAVVSYAKSNMATTATSASGYTLAYLYDMSKTVTLYGAYSHMGQDAGTNANSVAGGALGTNLTAGGSSAIVAVGIRKKF